MVEIEVKIKLNEPARMRDAILRLGGQLVKERFREDNTLYDFPSRTLTQKKCALRLRRAGRKIFLTFKGSPQKSRRFKVREEFETEVRNEKSLRHILRCLSLAPVFHYRKFRTVYQKDRLKICFDETPLGDFLELEGKRNEIMKLARALGFRREDLIKKDYVELLSERKAAR
ncbi:MAG: class IV adenylate cyclase [Candidatus Aminicenantales bacterium]